MSKLFLGSIDLTKIKKTDIVETDKNGQPFKNGAKYVNVAVWVDENPDEDWKAVSIKAGKKDESYYIGNAKLWQKDGNNANNQSKPEPKSNDKDDDLPF